MNKIRVIDVFNKIANGEEMPKKIKYKNKEYEYIKKAKDYQATDSTWLFYSHNTLILNDEVEMIEEKKKIEKILNKTIATLTCIKASGTIKGGEYYVIHSDFIIALEKEINEIIDYINKEQE